MPDTATPTLTGAVGATFTPTGCATFLLPKKSHVNSPPKTTIVIKRKIISGVRDWEFPIGCSGCTSPVSEGKVIVGSIGLSWQLQRSTVKLCYTMCVQITKYNHSCLVVEENEKTILLDPGNYSYETHVLD